MKVWVMKRFIAFISILFICTPSYSATYEASNNDAMPTVIYGKTSSGSIVPLQVDSSGSINPVPVGTEDSISGDNSKVIFPLSLDKDVWGRIRQCSYGLTNNECFDAALEETANRVVFKSTTGLNEYQYDGQVILKAVLVGASSFDVSSAMVAQYLFEENAASTAVDNAEGTAALDCVASANTSNFSTTGKVDLGFNFVAASSRYLDCGSNAALKFAQDFSTSVWVKTSSTGATKIIGGNRSASGNNNGWQIFVNSSNFAAFQVDAGSSTVENITGTTTITDGAWHHLAAGRIGSDLYLYVDGVSEGTQTGDVPQAMASVGNTYIGRTPQSTSYFNGDLDDFRIFNRGLTANEIKQIYNNSVGTTVASSSFNNYNVYIDGGVGAYGVKATGTLGGCLMLRDTDNAGWTECCALNGVLSCATDADGLIDGTL